MKSFYIQSIEIVLFLIFVANYSDLFNRNISAIVWSFAGHLIKRLRGGLSCPLGEDKKPLFDLCQWIIENCHPLGH